MASNKDRMRTLLVAILLCAVIMAEALSNVGCSRSERRNRANQFDPALDTFIREALTLEMLSGTGSKQPKYEEQLNLVESAFVRADLMWPSGAGYDKSRPLIVEALKEWRLCNELRVAALLDQIRAEAVGQTSELVQDQRLEAKSRAHLQQSLQESSDVQTHEERASHDFAQALEYLGKKDRERGQRQL